MGRKSRIARGLDISRAAKKMLEKATGTVLTDDEYWAFEHGRLTVEDLSTSHVVEEGKKYGLRYADRLRPLPELEKNEMERMWLASALDHDGSIGETRTYIQRKVDTIYRYWYRVPHVGYTTTTKPLSDKFTMLVREPPSIERRPPPLRPAYRHSIIWRKAISIIIYTRPNLIRLAETADRLLAKYKNRPAIPIAPYRKELLKPTTLL